LSIEEEKKLADEYYTNWHEMRYTKYEVDKDEIDELMSFYKDFYY